MLLLLFVDHDGEIRSVIFNSEYGQNVLKDSNFLIIKREILIVENTERTSTLFLGSTVPEAVLKQTKGEYWLPIVEENDCCCKMDDCDCDFDDDDGLEDDWE